MSSLIPERPLLVFPSLAATIGLEEAVLLSLLDELTHLQTGQESRGYVWYELLGEQLSRSMPFWDDLDIQRVSQRLRDVGILLLVSAPYGQSQRLKFAFNQRAGEQVSDQHKTTASSPRYHHENHQPDVPANVHARTHQSHQVSVAKPNAPQGRQASQGATLLPPNWQPDRDTLAMLSQLNIPLHFVREQLPLFVHYWRERGESNRTWGTKFIQQLQFKWQKHVAKTSNATALPENWQPSDQLQQQIVQEGIPAVFVKKSLQRFSLYHQKSGANNSHWDMPFFSWLKEDWEKQDTPFLNKKRSTSMSADWKPDQHTLTYLSTSQGIDLSFIDECTPEFIHKWIEKDALHSEWGTLFAEHIIQQWRFVQAGVERNKHPELIKEGWQPSADCIEILTVHADIEPDFILQQVGEFILYWRNRAQPMHSWDNIFLRHVKHQWKQHYERQQSSSGTGRTKDRSIAEQLTDRSWAS
ncbi:MAG: hypothetical protein ACI8VC_002784 [Candidatus Endobugula sp.]|jgi:hypothetical protein